MRKRRKESEPTNPIVDLLTPRQLQMVKMTFTGASNIQIGYLLGISQGTVREELSRAYKATGAANRPHLAALVWWELEGRLKPNGTH